MCSRFTIVRRIWLNQVSIEQLCSVCTVHFVFAAFSHQGFRLLQPQTVFQFHQEFRPAQLFICIQCIHYLHPCLLHLLGCWISLVFFPRSIPGIYIYIIIYIYAVHIHAYTRTGSHHTFVSDVPRHWLLNCMSSFTLKHHNTPQVFHHVGLPWQHMTTYLKPRIS